MTYLSLFIFFALFVGKIIYRFTRHNEPKPLARHRLDLRLVHPAREPVLQRTDLCAKIFKLGYQGKTLDLRLPEGIDRGTVMQGCIDDKRRDRDPDQLRYVFIARWFTTSCL